MLNKILFMFCVFALSGCLEEKPIYKKYTLMNGNTVTCGFAYTSNCGFYLTDCNDGKTYRCVGVIIDAK